MRPYLLLIMVALGVGAPPRLVTFLPGNQGPKAAGDSIRTLLKGSVEVEVTSTRGELAKALSEGPSLVLAPYWYAKGRHGALLRPHKVLTWDSVLVLTSAGVDESSLTKIGSIMHFVDAALNEALSPLFSWPFPSGTIPGRPSLLAGFYDVGQMAKFVSLGRGPHKILLLKSEYHLFVREIGGRWPHKEPEISQGKVQVVALLYTKEAEPYLEEVSYLVESLGVAKLLLRMGLGGLCYED